MATDSGTLSNPAEPSIPFVVVNLTHILKLTPTNYLSWKIQIEATLLGHGLYQYLDGTLSPPPKDITNPATSSTTTTTTTDTPAPKTPPPPPTILNPAYTTWFRQDKLILSALAGTLSPSIVPLISQCTTSREIWQTLAKTYANPSKGHLKQIKDRLRSITKGSRPVSDFMQELKTCTDQLASLGRPLDAEDIVDRVLDQLNDSDYDTIVHAVHSRDTPISFDELHEKLINHELSLKHKSKITTSFPATVNYMSKPPSRNPSNRFPNNNSGLLPNPTTPSAPPPSSRTPTTYNGKCQWCRAKGHYLTQCPIFRNQFPHATPPTPNPNLSPRPQNRGPPNPTAYTATTNPTSSPSWLFDSGATHHATHDLNNLALHSPYDGTEELLIGDGSGLSISNTGFTSLSNSTSSFRLNNVLHVPSLSRNIISISQFCRDNNSSVTFLPSSYIVKDLRTGVTTLQGQTNSGIYEWPPSSPAIHSVTLTTAHWHHRLGHPSSAVLSHLSKQFSLNVPRHISFHCNSCDCIKSHKLPFYENKISSSGPLDVLYTDVWTSPVYSYDGYKYYLIFVDHFSKFIWYYPLKHKSDVKPIFSRFKLLVEKTFNRPILTIYSDNGGEYIGLRPILESFGITHLTTPPHTPEHNGYSERRHRHIVETGLSLLTHASMPLQYWPLAFATSCYLINRLPTATLNMSSPFSILHHTPPNYTKLRSFGCLCYPWLRPYTTHKLEPRSAPCVFVGYSSTQSAYYCLDTSTHKIFVSRHVKFVEHVFPFSTSLSSSASSLKTTLNDWCTSTLQILQTTPPVPPSPPSPQHNQTSPPPLGPPSHCSSPTRTPVNPVGPPSTPDRTTPLAEITSPPPSDPPTSPPSSDRTPPPPSPISSTSPIPTPPPLPPPYRPITRSLNNIRKPNPKYNLHAKLSVPPEPTTISQALKSPIWRNAMQLEYDALIKNHTWDLVPPSPSHNLVGCKWVFRTKYNSDGSIDRHKARLVAKGFHQRPGLDYSETFSPVVKPVTIRTILSLATISGWSIRQVDINNAFLQGSLTEDVYMVQPPGFVSSSLPSHVCKLRQALYGLKQAPRAWYNELKSYLLSLGFKNSISDSSLFILHHNLGCLFVLVYVDDIIITGSHSSLLDTFIHTLSSRFSLKDLGPLSYFLGVEVLPHPHGILLSQQKYIIDLLSRAKMTDAKPVPTPMATHPPLTTHSGTPLSSPTDYRTLVGSLQYLSLTRFDISFAVNRLSQYLKCPTDVHWAALKRVLRYLAGTPSHGLLLRRDSPLSLHAFTDADWAGDKDDYISTTGYIVYLGKNPISWSSRKQRTLARSSTEAEYRAVAATTAEVLWVQNLLREISLFTVSTPVIYCDNMSTTYVAANPRFHSKMKHLGLDYHFVRENVQLQQLRVSHIKSGDQLADALTKPLPCTRFLDLMSKIGLTFRSSILRGDDRDTDNL